MKIYVTRHGQVISRGVDGNVQYPIGDPYLSELGWQQASCLGEYLKHLGFRGNIYCSPYVRTMETAQAIAQHTGSQIIPWAPIREIVKKQGSNAAFVGLTLEQLKERFPYIAPESKLDYPWWYTDQESHQDVIDRVRAGVDTLDTEEDVLLVGHGASVYCACEALQIPHTNGDGYNCSLSMYDTEDKSNYLYLNGDHLPYQLRTFNGISQVAEDQKLLEVYLGELKIPEDFTTTKTGKILHIGDTHSAHYPLIERIIEQVKPDIIIHTGDLVDEVKTGRIPNTREEYTEGVKKLAAILENSGAKQIYVTPGSNDIADVLKTYLPFAQIVAPNTVISIDGISCALGHSIPTSAAQQSFYSQGITTKTWSITLLSEQKQHLISRPKCFYWGKI